jgi:hypothetical protein
MSASQHHYTCATLGVCQMRNPACGDNCHPASDEAADTPIVTTDLVYLLGLILLGMAVALGLLLGSVLLHTWDTEIRHALLSAWDMLQRLYWAWANLNG